MFKKRLLLFALALAGAGAALQLTRGTATETPIKPPPYEPATRDKDGLIAAAGLVEAVAENVMVPLLIQGRPFDEARASALAILDKVGLKGREEGRPNALSGGQQQRVAIARALVHEPPLLICDEPTSALDKDTGAQIMQMVRDLSRSPERCVVVVTHDHRIFRFADRIAEMEDGRISRVVDDPKLLDTTHL